MSSSSSPARISHPTARENFSCVTVEDLTIWFSYTTPVAFRHPTTGQVVRENDWSNTTGKHLNHIDGGRKADRIPGAAFEAALAAFTVTVSTPSDEGDGK